jgi:hypothetical protein
VPSSPLRRRAHLSPRLTFAIARDTCPSLNAPKR